jgi:hypothetical protein
MIRWIRHNPGLVAVAAVVGGVWITAAAIGAGLNPLLAALLYVAVIGVAAVVGRRLLRPVDEPRMPVRTALAAFATGAVIVGVVIQAVPYGRARSNPPVTGEPPWDSAATEQLARAACYDCHSNEVDYPWYSYVAPFSWALQGHIEAGRRRLNFSAWDRPQRDAEEAAETVEDGSMPPLYYLFAHPAARLSAAEEQQLISGLEATIGEGERDERRHGDDDTNDSDDDD